MTTRTPRIPQSWEATPNETRTLQLTPSSEIVYVGVRSAGGAPRAVAVFHRRPQCGRKPNGPPRIRTWLADAQRAGMRECSWCGR